MRGVTGRSFPSPQVIIQNKVNASPQESSHQTMPPLRACASSEVLLRITIGNYTVVPDDMTMLVALGIRRSLQGFGFFGAVHRTTASFLLRLRCVLKSQSSSETASDSSTFAIDVRLQAETAT